MNTSRVRIRGRENGTEEDNVSQAGWMYADLFLALMVIFLATISFVPQLSQGLNAKGTARLSSSGVKTAASYNFDRGLTLLLKTPDSASLQASVVSFLASQKLPLNSQVVFMQVIGGYDPKTQTASDGLTTAVKFALKLREGNAQEFQNTTRGLDSSPDIPSGQVAIRLTFAAKFTK